MDVVEHGTREHARAVAERVAVRLAEIDGVVGVVLGGSHATGRATDDSDVDLGIYYRTAAPASRGALNALARDLDDEHRSDLVTRLGEWGPWVNGGAWTVVEGRPVDWLFRNLESVESAISAACAGRFTRGYSVGHPHGFHSTIYLAEIDACVPLADPEGAVAALKRRTRPYPEALKRELILHFLFEAGFCCQIAAKPTARGDVAYVHGALYRAVACLTQVLFALNERYCMNEKGAVAVAAALPLSPERFDEKVARLFEGSGPLERAGALVEEVRALVP
jgi:predicted nucleotidyltransferase